MIPLFIHLYKYRFRMVLALVEGCILFLVSVLEESVLF